MIADRQVTRTQWQIDRDLRLATAAYYATKYGWRPGVVLVSVDARPSR